MNLCITSIKRLQPKLFITHVTHTTCTVTEIKVHQKPNCLILVSLTPAVFRFRNFRFRHSSIIETNCLSPEKDGREHTDPEKQIKTTKVVRFRICGEGRPRMMKFASFVAQFGDKVHDFNETGWISHCPSQFLCNSISLFGAQACFLLPAFDNLAGWFHLWQIGDVIRVGVSRGETVSALSGGYNLAQPNHQERERYQRTRESNWPRGTVRCLPGCFSPDCRGTGIRLTLVLSQNQCPQGFLTLCGKNIQLLFCLMDLTSKFWHSPSWLEGRCEGESPAFLSNHTKSCFGAYRLLLIFHKCKSGL